MRKLAWIPVLCIALLVATFGTLVWSFLYPDAIDIAILGALTLSLVIAGLNWIWHLDRTLKANQKAERVKIQNLIQEMGETTVAIDALAEGLPNALFLCDTRGTIRYANPAAIQLFGFDSPAGRSLVEVTLSAELDRLAKDAAQQGKMLGQDLHFNYPNYSVGTATAWPHRANGSLVFVSIMETTDIQQLRQVRKDFVANVSHEFRTPLASIRAMAETLLEEESPPADLNERFLNKIVREVDRLSMISNDLLVLSAAETNPVRKNTCDLAALAQATLAENQKAASEKSLELAYEGPDELKIEANYIQISQVLANLVENAIKYTNEGSIRVTLKRDGTNAVLEVIDSGVGIPSEHLGRIFERFYRVDKARSRASGGTGLGLSIVKHIAEAHDGKIEVRSQYHAGSTFTVTLPIGNATAQPD